MTLPLDQFLASLAERSAYATVSQAGLDSEPLRRHLMNTLAIPPGTGDSFVADPVLEAAFGWQAADKTMQDLTVDILEQSLVDALDEDTPIEPGERDDRNRFPRDRQPYRHQMEAWRILNGPEARSVLVSSGTGSGKTECYLVPILNDLARQRKERGRLSGVQAIFLYPLNALINSQRDRLLDWTHAYSGDIRFCLFNGNTPDSVPADVKKKYPGEVQCRNDLRGDPPPILVTNITMLEYMLIRAIDAPIIRRSQGKLRWIVLDEAHSYVGSQAAEVSLLLRRVMRAFGAGAEDVRFIATSATIGGTEAEGQLRTFLADLAGVPESRVTVVLGQRDIPVIRPRAGDRGLPTASELSAMAPAAAFSRVSGSPEMCRLRDTLAERPRTLTSVVEILGLPREVPTSRNEALALLEQAATAVEDGRSFLPLRLHLFHRTQPGLWTCINPSCDGRAGTALDDPAWPYGRIYPNETERCRECGYPVFEIVGCNHCSHPFPVVGETAEKYLRPWRETENADEFAQELDEDPDGEEGDAGDTASPDRGLSSKWLLVDRGGEGVRTECLEVFSSRLLDRPNETGATIHLASASCCPQCGGEARKGSGALFRSLRFGAPFLLGNVVPHLLDYIEPALGGAALPAGGRQLITFSDSRQGTARFSAKLQQDAERNYIRSALYHMVQEAAAAPGKEEEIVRLRSEIAAIEPFKDASPPVRLMYDNMRAKLDEASKRTPTGIAWPDVRTALANLPDTRNWMTELWGNWDTSFSDANRIADVQLYRELLRRPRRRNSAETMGLVALRFPVIDKIQTASLPAPFRDAGLDLQDWKDYLQVLTAFFIRSNSAAWLPEEDLSRWLGVTFHPRAIKPPGEAADYRRRELAWPSARRRGRISRAIRLLQQGMRLNLDLPADVDRIDECLADAWRALSPLRAPGPGDFKLDMTKACLVRVSDAWFCPVTRRILDGCFAGMTPYQPEGMTSPSKAVSITMPKLPFPWRWRDGSAVSDQEVLDWLSDDPQIRELRERGVWSDLHDRIAGIVPYMRTAEHSAQQSAKTLKRYERRFKAKQINLLNCSTTMEMGVDIGGIKGVVMTNVPPTPANYRQRVGRAGRRGETLAFGLTLCTDTPLGWMVFRKPTWPFDCDAKPPAVALNSEVIVKRHVNALLLSAFFGRTGGDLLKLEAGVFFGRTGEGVSPATSFIAWCMAVGGLPQSVTEDIKAVISMTCLDGRTDLAVMVAAALEDIDREWQEEEEVLKTEYEAIPANDASSRKGAEIRLRRLREAYLLSELARRGFLPAHGFPTDVVPFINLSASQLRRMTDNAEKPVREDDRFKSLGFPSRQLDLALRDYAPGNDVVLDGLVYRSSGLTMNWKRPASAVNATEIQDIRTAWHCRDCGATDTTPGRPTFCAVCGKDDPTRVVYLRPSGFTIDIRAEPHTNVENTAFVPVRKPWISARDGRWTPLADPSVGRYRVSDAGHVFHFTLGGSGNGYAICLSCGRVAEEEARRDAAAPPLPKAIVDHKPLRRASEADRRHDGTCRGNDNPYAVKRHMALGYDLFTDIFELQLTGAGNEVVATSLAVAMREALATLIGVEAAELGHAAVEARGADGQKEWSMMLFDRAAGGAGFSSSAGRMVEELLNRAADVLDCSNPDCVRACHACLMTRDTQFDEALLDRNAALTFLRDTVLGNLILPADLMYFGRDSRAEGVPLIEALDRMLHSRSAASLKLWLGGPPRDWDLFAWGALPLLEKWGGRNRTITLVAEEPAMEMLTRGQRMALSRILERCRATLMKTSSLPTAGNGFVVAEISDEDIFTWAVSSEAARGPDDRWGLDVRPLVRARNHRRKSAAETKVSAEALADLGTVANVMYVGNQLNGPIKEFGARFWFEIISVKKDIGQIIEAKIPLTEIVYRDRYLFSPLVVRLLHEIIKPLTADRTRGAGSLVMTVRTRADRNRDNTGGGRYLHHDWSNIAHRNEVLRRALERSVTRVSLETDEQRNLPHDRTLSLKWANGETLLLYLDQGLGHWETVHGTAFPFTAPPIDQASHLATVNFAVMSRSAFPMAVFILDGE